MFFDLKDEESSVSCFMPVWNLRTPIEDGMKIVARGFPKVTGKGKFSFTVNAVKPVGEGSLKKAYEILKKKLTDEGLFDPAKKRPLPEVITKIGVISSTQAAGYADFIKIINARWGGMKVQVAHTLVQGMDAPDQIVKALKHFNERGEMDVIVIIRGGGSADDCLPFLRGAVLPLPVFSGSRQGGSAAADISLDNVSDEYKGLINNYYRSLDK